MTGFVTAPGKKRMLDVLVGGSASSSTSYLGLATGLATTGAEPNLATIKEVTTAGYTRQAVAWNPAPLAPSVFVDNSAQITFGPLTDNMPTANYAFLCDVASGNAINVPVLSLGSATSGGTFAAGAYYWVVTAINAQGETTASNEVSATLSANQKQTLNWGAITGATGYNIYRGTLSGGENVLVTTVGAVTTYTDTGTSTTQVSPPDNNSAPVGNIWYVWNLAEPVQALAGKPVYVPVESLIIE